MPVCDVAKFCLYWGLSLPHNVSTAMKLFVAAKHFHKCTDLVALDFVHVRVAMRNAQAELLRELLEIEEAADILPRDDLQKVQAEQQRAVVELEEQDAPTKDYIEMKRSCLRKDATSKPKDKMLLPLELTQKKYPKKAPMKFEQVFVKDFLPPSVSCWRGNVRNEWWCHCQPYPRHAEPLERHGGDEQACIVAMLQEAWRQWLQKAALPLSECPIEGLCSAVAK